MHSDEKPLALCLSGGGIRAMAFHAGVMRSIAKSGKLENVKYISTVSGGSLLIGMIYSQNNHKWPDSQTYIKKIEPKIKSILTKNSLVLNSFFRCINPLNYRYLLSRSNIIAQSLESTWKVNGTIGKINGDPEWSINGTSLETGRRFRIKGISGGDYKLGYFEDENFPLSQAIAMSAGVPGVIGPLVINAEKFNWHQLNYPTRTKNKIQPKFKKLHIYDGGIYDNLGTEQFFDIGKQRLKPYFDNCELIVSDAGSPFSLSASAGKLNPKRLLRVNDIMMDQSRSLRVRSLMNYYLNKRGAGAYIRLGDSSNEVIKLYSLNLPFKSQLTEGDISHASTYNTTLFKMPEKSYNILSAHGEELTSILKDGKRLYSQKNQPL
ncbi:patatin-like phospholipase family protein [Vibrio hepatarius]|uniref:patatin-like phospholipase family protein n=1 Tax=Vibrio hepatarius TaxID=171383 RepID=UPI003735B231